MRRTGEGKKATELGDMPFMPPINPPAIKFPKCAVTVSAIGQVLRMYWRVLESMTKARTSVRSSRCLCWNEILKHGLRVGTRKKTFTEHEIEKKINNQLIA